MDIKVIGAGLSGLSAAFTLAKSGFEVTVYELGRKPSSRIITGIQGFKNFGKRGKILWKIRKDLKLPISSKYFLPLKRGTLLSPSFRECEIYSREPIFYLVKRGFLSEDTIDMQLYFLARDAGAKFIFNKRMEEREGNIVASGPRKGVLWASVMHFENKEEGNEALLYYNNNYAEGGYIWVFRYQNLMDIGILTSKRDKFLPQKLRKLISRLKPLKERTGRAKLILHTHGIGFYDIPSSARRDGRCYVGEAAGFLNASKGEGMYYALASGCLAAKSIITGEDYDKLWKKEFKEELVEGFKKRTVWERMKNKDYEEMIGMLGSRISLEEYREKVRKWMKSKPAVLLYPFFLMKWKLLGKL
ncbi:MAG: NAD(P)/FAD-dependent oxidoreductase [Candidatus Nanoarchaeia archaeon]|nr:NAD(P)/FAD-dependent oxidoreductase [Candidatus Haiyanarchaeum thermophilum]MCW1302877.1 NAD(P)/FAD-dependent oxidoreductase [Candidatus Haiyanarchaeum thermophilum]MCW1303556.1 NAD(P)/FAD-dependent oxidoreductase [Candidatus Haiyanarchaeum thermophilum]MCW1306238.1 NAD(P)/FAD-dependent oxidoreductase [Candidatus Haiyanarchaeum thermophilum]MCW1309016.1 NAD(P)/FAD-dependent oxidoreductase [Candidatus Haiyanarchaeum thermophilum]